MGRCLSCEGTGVMCAEKYADRGLLTRREVQVWPGGLRPRIYGGEEAEDSTWQRKVAPGVEEWPLGRGGVGGAQNKDFESEQLLVINSRV